MKRFTASTVLAVAFLVTSAVSAFALDGLQVGVRAGYNYNMFTIGSFESDDGMGGGAGISIRYSLVPDVVCFVIEPSFYYRSIGQWDESVKDRWSYERDVDKPGSSTKEWIRYRETKTMSLTEMVAQVPILIQYTYEDKYYVQGGVQLGIPVGTKLNLERKSTRLDSYGNIIAKSEKTTETTLSLKDVTEEDYGFTMERSQFEADLVIGVGYMLTPNFGIDIRVAYSLLEPIKYTGYDYDDVTEANLSDPNWKPESFTKTTTSMSVGLGLSVYF